jgi:hypothetical protein
MPTDIRTYAADTHLVVEYPFGWYRAGRAICSDGRTRTLKRIALTADTFFSTPAAVTVNGRTVSGYITVETLDGYTTATGADPAVVKFVANSYGANADALPAGKWTR